MAKDYGDVYIIYYFNEAGVMTAHGINVEMRHLSLSSYILRTPQLAHQASSKAAERKGRRRKELNDRFTSNNTNTQPLSLYKPLQQDNLYFVL